MRGDTTGYPNAGGTAGLLYLIFPSQKELQGFFWDFFREIYLVKYHVSSGIAGSSKKTDRRQDR